jgi:hypothetical protein
MIFEISDVVEQIHRAQRRADRLREAQALVVRGDEIVVTPFKYAVDPLEVCWPCDCEVCA